MTAPQLDSIVEKPIAISPEHVAANPSKLIVKQRGMSFSGGDINVWIKDSETDAESHSDSHNGNKAPPSFICKGKAFSWTQRRTLSESAGLSLFEICRQSSGVTWFVHVPGHDTQAVSRPLVTLAMERSAFKDKFDVCVHGKNGKDVQLKVRGQDIWKLRANVYWGEKVVMTTKRQGKLDAYIPGKSLVWEVDVAPGFDTSLATVIMIVMIANLYDSSMKSSSDSGAAIGAAIGAGAGAGAAAGAAG